MAKYCGIFVKFGFLTSNDFSSDAFEDKNFEKFDVMYFRLIYRMLKIESNLHIFRPK